MGENLATRVKQLQAEAKGLAEQHMRELMQQVGDAMTTAAQIAGGGEAYPAGVRDLARQMADDLESKLQTLQAIVAKADR